MRTSALFLLALIGLASAGCLYVGGSGAFGADIDRKKVATIKPGVTTKAEVLQLLGPPNEFKRPEANEALVDDTVRLSGAVALGNRSHDVFTYQFDKLGADGTWLLLFFYMYGKVDSDLLVIFFDAKDVVKDVSFREVTRDQ
jgi:hypothetical protein